jgi:EAL domain-containing protein (putative c-di-GMP-specific phosphodiesterase class I)
VSIGFEIEMIESIGKDSIALHYQPLIRSNGNVAGMEALMRWHHHARGPMSPEAFIPIFERSGLMVQLSRWALEQACFDAVAWSNGLVVAANLSAVQFERDDLPRLVRSVLDRSRLAPDRLELEVTETTLQSAGDVANAMFQIREHGVHLVLAGFGVGASAPSFLDAFPFSKLKIASRLVSSLETSVSARSIIHMIVELGHARGLAVAAEGVETPGQLAFLRNEGCDWIQGFLIGRPAPISTMTHYTGTAIADLGPKLPQSEYRIVGDPQIRVDA